MKKTLVYNVNEYLIEARSDSRFKRKEKREKRKEGSIAATVTR